MCDVYCVSVNMGGWAGSYCFGFVGLCGASLVSLARRLGEGGEWELHSYLSTNP